jgi:Flp pilus assembly secretin CpaC
MGDRAKEPEPYLVEHVRDALAHDPRVGELDVTVEVEGETVVLSGSLSSPERRQAAAEVARDLLPDHQVRNETSVAEFDEPTEAEHLP